MPTAREDDALQIDRSLLKEIERTAVELARLAGAEIVTALGGMLAVKYKRNPRDDEENYRDPVSEVDHRVETLLREQISTRFPDHRIIGEEMDETAISHGTDADFVWAVDPIDGTMNFINGFPLFAASVGVLYRRRPIAGAVWCATSHALHAGVYHGRLGAQLCFDDVIIEPKANPAVMRRLAGEPSLTEDLGFPWEVRKTGSAAIECAFVAAGLLRVARFTRPNIWDVAGGVALIRSAGFDVRAFANDGWKPFERFEPVDGSQGSGADLRKWRQSLILGEILAVDQLCLAHTPVKAAS